MMKISFVGHTCDRGGASHVLTHLANEFASMGWDVDLVFLRVRNMYDVSSNVNVISLCDANKGVSPVKAFSVLKKYYRNCASKVVISFLLPINCLSILALLGSKKKLIISERNDPKIASSKLMFAISKMLYNMADRVVFQTERVKSYYSKNIQRKSQIILNPLNIAECKREKIQNEIVAVGKLFPQKNHALLLRAFAKYLEIEPSYYLSIYGDGPLKNELQSLAKDLNIESKVRFMGNVPDVQQRISSAKMFVLTSDFEGLSNALMEAMCLGLPCISTRCAGSDEIIKNQENGLLVECGDVNGLVDAMKKISQDQAFADKISNNAMKLKNVCEKKFIVEKWRKLIRDNI